jgi:DNA-binding NarL/FixJ family response regulator
MGAKIKIIIVDDHHIVREGLTTIINFQDDMEIVGEASDGLQAIEMVNKFHPDLVLMDLRMPNLGGAEAIQKIRESNPEVKFVILTTFKEDNDVFEGVSAGARGYLLKDTPSDEIIKAIRKVNNGETLMESSMYTRVLDRFSKVIQRQEFANDLTRRELDVLKLLADGASNKIIAEKLFISIKTVKTHITHIFEKLDVKNRTEAVAKAHKSKLF